MKRTPLIWRITKPIASRQDALMRAMLACDWLSHKQARQILPYFRLHANEREFARHLLDRKSQYWLYRVNQRVGAGDFVAVNMSGAGPDQRSVYVIELKCRPQLNPGGGRAGYQLRNAQMVVNALAGDRVASQDGFQRICGNPAGVVDYL